MLQLTIESTKPRNKNKHLDTYTPKHLHTYMNESRGDFWPPRKGGGGFAAAPPPNGARMFIGIGV